MKAQKILLVLCIGCGAAKSESTKGCYNTKVEARSWDTASKVKKEGALLQHFKWQCKMFQHNRLVQFLLGKRQTPPGSTHEQTPGSSSQGAVDQAVLDSEVMMAADPAEEEENKRSLNGHEVDAHLQRLGIMEKEERSFLSSVQDDSKKRDSLVKEVLALILREPESSLAGRQTKGCGSSEEKLDVVKRCLGDTRTNYIGFRLAAIRSYLSWADKLTGTLEEDSDDSHTDNKEESCSWPATEAQAYKYVQHIGATTNSKRFLDKRFLEALVFLQDTLGFDFSSVLQSTRLPDYASTRTASIGPIRKAAVATDSTVAKWEVMVNDESMPVDLRLSAGSSLIKFLTRTRRSDWAHKTGVVERVGFLEVEVNSVKSISSLDRPQKTLLGPIWSFTGRDWWSTYMNLRDTEGIPLATWPLMPTKSEAGWRREDCPIADENRLIKEVLVLMGENPERHSSRTPKKTAIALAARHGLPRDVLSILAYHKAGSNSTNTCDSSKLWSVMEDWQGVLDSFLKSSNWNEIDFHKAEMVIYGEPSQSKTLELSDHLDSSGSSSCSVHEPDETSELEDLEEDALGYEITLVLDDNRQGPWLAPYHVNKHISTKELEETDKVLDKAFGSLEDSELGWLKLCCRCANPDDTLELEEDREFLEERGFCGLFCDVCKIRPCLREEDHAGSGPPFGHCLCSLASRGVNCATIEKVEIADVKKHRDGVEAGIKEASRLMKTSDRPLALDSDSSLPSSSSRLNPPGEFSSSSATDDEALRAGLLVHRETDRVHVCGESGELKTRCGLAFRSDLKLKTTPISCLDLKCAECFRTGKVPLPGRQAA